MIRSLTPVPEQIFDEDICTMIYLFGERMSIIWQQTLVAHMAGFTVKSLIYDTPNPKT